MKCPTFLEIKESTIEGAGKGVFAKRDIKKHECLGEYKGKLLSVKEFKRKPHHCDYVWELLDDEQDVIGYIDGGNKKYSNWTRYVNCPSTEKQNNVVPIQKQFKMYYYAKRDVSAGEELFVWYGSVYAKKLMGITDLK